MCNRILLSNILVHNSNSGVGVGKDGSGPKRLFWGQNASLPIAPATPHPP